MATTNSTDNHEWTTAPDYHDATCDYCTNKAGYDAATLEGPWAFVCETHFWTKTSGKLGLGYGQRLIPMSEVK